MSWEHICKSCCPGLEPIHRAPSTPKTRNVIALAKVVAVSTSISYLNSIIRFVFFYCGCYCKVKGMSLVRPVKLAIIAPQLGEA